MSPTPRKTRGITAEAPVEEPFVLTDDWVQVPDTDDDPSNWVQVDDYNPWGKNSGSYKPNETKEYNAVYVPEKNITINIPVGMPEKEAAARVHETAFSLPIYLPPYIANQAGIGGEDRPGRYLEPKKEEAATPDGVKLLPGEPIEDFGEFEETSTLDAYAKEFAYYPSRILSAGVEEPAWALTSMLIRGSNAVYKFGHNVATDLGLAEDLDAQSPGFLDRALEFYSNPQEHGYITPWATKEKARRDAHRFQTNYVWGLAGRMGESVIDLLSFLAPLSFGTKIRAAGAVTKTLTKASANKAMLQHLAKMGSYGFVTHNGEFSERTKSALFLVAYGLTGPMANATGAVGIRAVALNTSLNNFLNFSTYKAAFHEAGGINKEFFAMILPVWAMDFTFAFKTRGLPENRIKAKAKQFLKHRAKEMDMTVEEYVRIVKENHKILADPEMWKIEDPQALTEQIRRAKDILKLTPEESQKLDMEVQAELAARDAKKKAELENENASGESTQLVSKSEKQNTVTNVVEGLADLYKRKSTEASKARFDRTRKVNQETANKQSKADGLKRSATLRKLKGEPTATELNTELKRLNSNHMGKKVITPTGEATVSGPPSFGRIKVKFRNGREKFIPAEDVQSPTATKQDAINSLRSQAEAQVRAELKAAKIPTSKQPKHVETTVETVDETVVEPVTIKKRRGKSKKKKDVEVEKKEAVEDEVDPETNINELALGVERKARNNKLVDKFEDLPEYKRINLKTQAEVANNLLEIDPARAIRIAMGEEAPPKGLLPEMVFKAVEEKANAEKNIELIHKLATKSSLVTEATQMGQRIRALGERDPNSPVAVIHTISKQRKKAVEKILEKKHKTVDEATIEVENEIKKEIKKKSTKKGDWETFIKGIEC